MNCEKCGNNEFNEKGNCLRCGAPKTEKKNEQTAGWAEILGVATAIGICWFGRKLLQPATPQNDTPMTLPSEFQDQRSRPSTEISGQPVASDLLAIDREAQKRQHQAQIGQMWIEHARTMNKINLGLKS